MTPAQRALLARVVARPGLRLNGRARRTVDALERLGLVTVERELFLHARGDSSWVLTLKPTPAGVIEVTRPRS